MLGSIKTPRTIVITGGSSGIGAALVRAYACPGVFIAISGRNRERLDEVMAACKKQGAEGTGDVVDVTDRSAMAAWLTSVHRDHPIDLIIANAGISGGTSTGGVNDDRTRHILDVNITGVINTIQPVIPLMRERKSGQIAIISSLAGLLSMPGAPAYSTSKAAVRTYGEALRGWLAKDNVTSSVILPGFVKSGITDNNRFPMPMLMEADKAAAIIKKGLARDRARIAFPLPMYLIVRAIGLLPTGIISKLLRRTPAKE